MAGSWSASDGAAVGGGPSRAGTDAGAGARWVAQEAIMAQVARTSAVRQTFAFASIRPAATMDDHPLFWIFLELALGLALFVFLVWWTLPKKDKGDDGED
jgi:hypothetical protein